MPLSTEGFCPTAFKDNDPATEPYDCPQKMVMSLILVGDGSHVSHSFVDNPKSDEFWFASRYVVDPTALLLQVAC